MSDLAIWHSPSPESSIREGCRTLPVKRVLTFELHLIDTQRYFADHFARKSKYGRARRAHSEGDSGLIPLLTMFFEAKFSYAATDSFVPK